LCSLDFGGLLRLKELSRSPAEKAARRFRRAMIDARNPLTIDLDDPATLTARAIRAARACVSRPGVEKPSPMSQPGDGFSVWRKAVSEVPALLSQYAMLLFD
jgi:hypothetical protein